MRTVSTRAAGRTREQKFGMKTVMVFGTFDILHPGHLSLFRQAKRHGKILVAVVARGTTSARIKGRAPFHTERERKKNLEHIRDIDRVLLGDTKDMYRVIRRLQPDVIALGYDQKFFVKELQKIVHEFSKPPRIVRLRPYQAGRYKTKKIRGYLDI